MLRAHQRMESHYQARMYTDMAAITTALANNGETYQEELASAEIRAKRSNTKPVISPQRAAQTTASKTTVGHSRISPTVALNGQAHSATPTSLGKTRREDQGRFSGQDVSDEVCGQRDLHVACESIAHGTTNLCSLSLLGECISINTGNRCIDGKCHRTNTEAVVTLGEGCYS